MTRQFRSASLSVQQLLTFRRVFELGGYTPAAAESNVSVASVWQQIRAVEQAYNLQLFRKVGRKVVATPEAHQLHSVLDEILVDLESTFDVLGEHSLEDAPIRVVAGNRMMLEDLAEPFSKFRQQFPNQLVLRSGSNRVAEELLMNDQVDLGLSLEPTPDRKLAKIHYQSGYLVDFLAVAPKKHPFVLSKSTSLRELVKYPLVVTVPGTHGREALEQALYRERLTADIVVETDNSAITFACVEAGMGLGIVAGRANGPLGKKLAMVSLKRQLGQREIVFMWRKGRRLTEPMVSLVELISEHRTNP